MDPRSQEKKQQLERALEKGKVMIHLDARQPGVLVPTRFHDDYHLRLNLSLRFIPPDLSTSEWGVRETLSFGGTPFSVAVPWQAIFAISGSERTDQAWLYPEDMPKELFEEAARQFGLSGDEVDKLHEEAEGIDQPDAPAPASDPVARRRALQVVRAITGEFEIPEIPKVPEIPEASKDHEEPAGKLDEKLPEKLADKPALAPVEAAPEAEAPAPVALEGKPTKHPHLRLVK